MAKGDESVQISTGNPFGVLAKKKFKGDPNKFTSSDSKATKKTDDAPAVKQVVDKGPAKASRQLRLTESEKPEPTKEVSQDPPAESKKEREAKDKHVDRSGKRDQTRKQGQGKGGWDDNATTDIEKAATSGDEPEKEEGEARTEENATNNKKEEKPEEEEAPTTTYEDYLKAQAEKKLNLAQFKIRQVDESQFKQMTVRPQTEDTFMSVKLEKPAPKAAPAPAGKGAKTTQKAQPAKPAPKQEAPKKKEVKETKVELSDLGFRVAPRDTGRGGRGGGRGGRGRGRGDGENNNTENRESRPPRGRGGYQGGRGRGGDRGAGGNFQMNENDFPVLGNKKEESAPASE